MIICFKSRPALRPILIGFIVLMSVAKVIAQETYFLVTDQVFEEKNYNVYVEKGNKLAFDTENGKLMGSFEKRKFSGNYIIKRTSSGFSKGFYYTVDFGFLQRDFTNQLAYNQYTLSLININRFYFYPDNLANTRWDFLELQDTNGAKKIFVRAH